jgi:hypothetical protein
MSLPSQRRVRLIPLVWGLCVCIGLGLVIQHDLTAGREVDPPLLWPDPAESLLPNEAVPKSEPATLGERAEGVVLLFLHPHCPCSRASLDELTRVLAASATSVRAFVVFVKPSGTPQYWEESGLWDAAKKVPGLRVVSDEGGHLAQLFRATHSGQICLYRRGRLVFHGGVTAGRGHSGQNVASESLARQLADARGVSCSPVFGCPLLKLPEREGAIR